MAQGNHKLGKAKKSGGAQKRKVVKTVKKKQKGGSKLGENNSHTISATKSINRKNERIIAAKALNGGTAFYLKDIAEKGKQRRTVMPSSPYYIIRILTFELALFSPFAAIFY
jgi:hypothetical protein